MTLKLLDEAIQETRLAYQFLPSSYTYGAMLAVAKAARANFQPDWIEEYLAYQ